MGIRFSKSVKLGNYLRLNISKSGVSASIGKKGATVNIGNRGTFLNLSPSLLGINGTGLSYRKKIGGGTSSFAEQIKNAKKPAPNTKPSASIGTQVNNMKTYQEVLEEYEKNLEARIHLHKYTEKVMNQAFFDDYAAQMEAEAGKELYLLNMAGDEDTIENFIGSFMNNLELPYDARVNYELEDHVLYVDLDLPEIENLPTDYPAISSGKLISKKKTSVQMKEEYAQTVMSLGVFLSANFFNLSPYIQMIVMSGFTSVRNRDGDLVDQYLYSVKYTRDIFEETDLHELEDLYAFICRFENRINLSQTFIFKAIKPYEDEDKEISDAMLEEAVLALKELGFSDDTVRKILPALSEEPEATVSDYVKKGLKLLSEG